MTARLGTVLIAAAAGLVFAGCPDDGGSPRASPKREVTVFAASSLREAMQPLAAAFARQEAGTKVSFNFGGSGELRAQLESGATADVIATADLRTLDALSKAGLARDVERFICNHLVIVVPRENPAQVSGLDDLRKAQKLVLGAPEVPVGAYTDALLVRAEARLGREAVEAIRKNVVSREPNVRQVLAKVVLGEADAAIVYVSDAVAAGDKVKPIPLPEELLERAEYPVAVASTSKSPEAAKEFVSLLKSSEGQRILRQHGFVSCGETPED